MEDYSIINADSVEYIAQEYVILGRINAPIILLDTPKVYSLDIDLQQPTVVIGNSEKQTELLPQMGIELFTVIGNTTFPLVFVDILPKAKGLPNIIELTGLVLFNIFDQTKETVTQESESSNKSIPNLITFDPEVPNADSSDQ